MALVMMSGVQYYTGQRFDIKTITKAARDCQIAIGWDLGEESNSHHSPSLPLLAPSLLLVGRSKKSSAQPDFNFVTRLVA